MKIIKIDKLEKINDVEHSLIIGKFNPLHKGHLKLINQMKGKKAVLKINHNSIQNLDIFENKNIDLIIIIELEKIKNNTKYEFIEFLKINKFNDIYIGKDFKFGKDRKGSKNDLKKYGFSLHIIDFLEIKENKISSSYIRQLLKEGSIKKANEYLCENFNIKGRVFKNKQLARKLGYKTANFKLNKNINLKSGVYKTTTIVDNKKFKSITNIGYKPTIKKEKENYKSVETHIFNFDKDIYNQEIKVILNDFLRSEIKFKCLEELKEQIKKDIKKINN